MSVRTEPQVSSEENGIGHGTADDEVPPPLIVEGEIDANRTEEILEMDKTDDTEGYA